MFAYLYNCAVCLCWEGLELLQPRLQLLKWIAEPFQATLASKEVVFSKLGLYQLAFSTAVWAKSKVQRLSKEKSAQEKPEVADDEKGGWSCAAGIVKPLQR
jgi:hypothetical protein